MVGTPDDMGADSYNERQNMREARAATPEPTHDVVAVSPEGEDLYVTESVYSETAAQEEAVICDEHLAENHIEGVDHFEVRER